MTDPKPGGLLPEDPATQDLIRQLLQSNLLTQGPLLVRFEEELARLCEAPHCVAVANGTMALYLACLAADLGPGDKFLTTPMTFAATANAGLYCGAQPVFADIDPVTLNLDPEQAARALARHPEIKVMLPVHFGGLMCDLDRLADLAETHGVTIIEDACHALGGHWRDRQDCWHAAGSCHRTAQTTFSFHPLKSMTTGEGGAVTTGDAAMAERLRLLRSHGITRDPALMAKNDGGWYHEMIDLGINARLTDLQAALGLHQLRQLPGWRQRRLAIVGRYGELLGAVPGLQVVTRPRPGDRSCYHLMIVRSDRRRALYDHLHSRGIAVQVNYIPVHLEPYYQRKFGFRAGDFPLAEQYYEETLSLPLHPGLTDEDLDRVATAIREIHA